MKTVQTNDQLEAMLDKCAPEYREGVKKLLMEDFEELAALKELGLKEEYNEKARGMGVELYELPKA
jgi:hypothetical protein